MSSCSVRGEEEGVEFFGPRGLEVEVLKSRSRKGEKNQSKPPSRKKKTSVVSALDRNALVSLRPSSLVSRLLHAARRGDCVVCSRRGGSGRELGLGSGCRRKGGKNLEQGRRRERHSFAPSLSRLSSYVLVVSPESRQGSGSSRGARRRRRRRRCAGGQRRRAAEREEQRLRPHG